MKKTLYAALTSVLFSAAFLGGASLALADTAQPLSFYCEPYGASFVDGQAYEPTEGGFCNFQMDSFDPSALAIVEIYKGVPGNATLLDSKLRTDCSLSSCTTTDSFGNAPQPGDAYFSVGYVIGTDISDYVSTGTNPPTPDVFRVLSWHWGTPATVRADDQTIHVGDALPTLTATVSGFVNGDTLATSGITGSASCTTSAADSSVAGDFPITCTQGSLASTKYSFTVPTASYVGGVLHVVPPQLTVTANDASMVYGGTIQNLSAILGGFINGQTMATSDVTGEPLCSTTATSASPAGSYPITCTIGTLASQNYSFGTFFPGLFTILPAPLTVTADDKSMVSGSAMPMLTATLSGFVNGESLGTSGVTGGASCSTSATSASPAGSYSITCSAGSLSSHNYTFASFLAGTLVITSPIGPTLTITNPVANQTYEKSDSVMLGITVVDTAPIVSTTALFDGVPFDPAQPIPFYTASPGTSTVNVTVRDANGLSATASVSFLITRPGGDQCYTEAEGWWNRGWVWTSDDFYHVLIDCSDLDHFHRDRHDVENDHNHGPDWKKKSDDISKGVKDRSDDMDKRIHKNSH